MAKQDKVTINGTEYHLQHPGARWVLRLQTRAKYQGEPDLEKMAQEYLENVVVQPKVTLDDFDEDFETLEELVTAINSFLRS